MTYTVEAAIIFENDAFTVVPAAKKGVATCDLWADIEPTGLQSGDYKIVTVYATDDWRTEDAVLTGMVRDDAIKVLKADEGWCQWAFEEAAERRAA